MGHKDDRLEFYVIYKKGREDVVADELSRKEEDTKALLCVIFILQVDWVEATR
jgi:hypothetical protein